jgi:hypothetical protein
MQAGKGLGKCQDTIGCVTPGAARAAQKNGTEKKMGAYVMKTLFQTSCISSGMFITAMAANPLAVDLAKGSLGETIRRGPAPGRARGCLRPAQVTSVEPAPNYGLAAGVGASMQGGCCL